MGNIHLISLGLRFRKRNPVALPGLVSPSFHGRPTFCQSACVSGNVPHTCRSSAFLVTHSIDGSVNTLPSVGPQRLSTIQSTSQPGFHVVGKWLSKITWFGSRKGIVLEKFLGAQTCFPQRLIYRWK